MANSDMIAKVTLEIDQSSVNSEVDKSSRLLKQKLNNMGTIAGKAAGQNISKNIENVSKNIERSADKASKILEKGLKFGIGLGTASIVAFLKSGTVEAAKFNNRLDSLKSSVAKLGGTLSTKIDIFGGKSMYQWVDVLDNKLNSLSTDKLQEIVHLMKVGAAVWTGVTAIKGVAAATPAILAGGSAIKGAFTGGVSSYAAAVAAATRVKRRSTISSSLALGDAAFAAGGYSKLPVVTKIGSSLRGGWSGVKAAATTSISAGFLGSAAALTAAAALGTAIGVGLQNFFRKEENKLSVEDFFTGLKELPNYLGEQMGAGAGFWKTLFPYLSKDGTPKPIETPADDQLKADITASVEAAKRLRIQKEQNDILDRSFTQRAGMRDFNKVIESQKEQYAGEVPFEIQRQNLPKIADKIEEFNKIIDDLEKQLKDTTKELRPTLTSALEEAITQRAGLISEGKSIVGAFVASKERSKDILDTRSEFSKKKAELEDSWRESQKELRPGDLTLGAEGTSIPSIIAEALNKAEEEKIQRDKDLVEYNKKMAEIDEERLKFEKDEVEKEKERFKTISDQLKEINKNTKPSASAATGIPLL